MSLAYRLGSVAFIMALMALALYILTSGILGRKIHWKSLGIFFYLRGGVPMVGNVSVPFIYRSNRAGEHSFRSL